MCQASSRKVMYRLVAKAGGEREGGGEPAPTQPDACRVSKVSNPAVTHGVNNGACAAELPQAPFLG